MAPIRSSDFQILFESVPSLLTALNPDLTIEAASDAYIRATKKPRHEVIGKNFFDIIPPISGEESQKHIDNLRHSFLKVLRTKQIDVTPAHRFDTPREVFEGGGFDIRYWASVNTPLLSPSGDVAYILRRVEDMTSFKAVELERDLFFMSSIDLLAVVGSDGYFKRVNPSFERVMGYTPDEMFAKPVVQFLHPDDVSKTKVGISKLAAGTSTIESVNRYLCKDGTYRWFSWNTKPIGDLFYTVGRDITDKVLSEEKIRNLNLELAQKNENLEIKIQERVSELRKSEAQLQQLQKMDAIGRLAGGIAHDFNNMLSAMSIYCDVILEEASNPESVKEKATALQGITARAAALTRQLLVFSRQQLVQLQSVNINPLILELEKMLARLIGENIKIVKNLAPDLKEISMDPVQMEQVILNLVVNAKDALPNGGTITIETSNVYLDDAFSSTHLSVKNGDYVMLAISDNGIGMNSDTLKKIFEPFFTTKPVGQGTGLGLSTAYGIVKQSNGTIWVYSEPNKGTVFKIYLPVCETIPQAPAVSSVKVAAATGTETILLVEDEDLLREAFSTMLERKGYTVLSASHSAEALELSQSHSGPIHLLLTDMVMPGLTGIELAKKIKATRKDIRVLYMSGYTSDALENSGTEAICQTEFIQKPFNTAALIAKVQAALE